MLLIWLLTLARGDQLLAEFFNYLYYKLPDLFTNNQQLLCQLQKQITYTALTSTVSECLWIRSMLDEMQILLNKTPTLLYYPHINEDNQVLHNYYQRASQTPKAQTPFEYCFLNAACDNGNIQIKYIPTTDQIGDIFIKSLPLNTF